MHLCASWCDCLIVTALACDLKSAAWSLVGQSIILTEEISLTFKLQVMVANKYVPLFKAFMSIMKKPQLSNY
jgi:hypothetical protein